MQTVLRSILIVCLLSAAYSHPLCRSGSGPFPGTLSYCSMYTEDVCCTANDDSRVSSAISALGVTGECLTFMQKNLCAECDPWAIHLFDGESDNAPTNVVVPFMCNEFCAAMYEACKDQVMTANPYDSQRRNISLGNVFATSGEFCQAFAHTEEEYCFDGNPFVPPASRNLNGTGFLCLAKVINGGGYLNLLQPDNRIFISSKDGVIQTVNATTYAVTGTYLDISSRVWDSSERGFLGLAFHPDFTTNGRFFVSYSCDPSIHPECRWPCSRGCPWGSGTCTNGFCAMHDHMSIIAEYRAANGNPSASTADAAEVQRIFEYTQPYGNHNGGQILFGADGYLYLMFGDGGDGNDPQQTGQDRQNYLGKILRIDVDNKANGKNYAIPADNPFVGNSQGTLEEIYAMGLRNPWRCSFDRSNPAYFFCGDVGQNHVEEVDLIVKGGNYGWRRYEGTRLNIRTDPEIDNHILPILEYNRTEVGNPASIAGGYRYRGNQQTCLTDNYIFADSYTKYFAAVENPAGSGKFERRNLRVFCANNSPLTCSPDLGFIFSFGEDATGELYMLTGNGVHKIVEASRCGLTCSTPVSFPNPNNNPNTSPRPSVSSASRARSMFNLFGN